MFAELLLGSVLATAGGVFVYLYRDHQRSLLARRQDEEARARAEVERKRAIRTQFRTLLVQELRSRKPSGFSFSEFARSCEVARPEADEVADDLYLDMARKAVADGLVTPEERRRLDALAGALEIGMDRARSIEDRAKVGAYRQAVAGALADGEVSDTEAAELKALRMNLGIDDQHALAMSSDLTGAAYVSLIRRVVQVGAPNRAMRDRLSRFREGLALTDPRSLEPLHSQIQ
jgi:hypothetical protein